MAVTKAIFDVIERDGLLEHARQLGEHVVARIKADAPAMAKIAEIRGKGLFLGIEMKEAPKQLVEKCLEAGVVVNVTADKVVRLAPPINITKADLDEGLTRLLGVIHSL